MNEILKLFYNLTYFYSDSHINESQSTREDSRTINMEKYKYWIPELVKLTNTFPISNQILSPPHSFTINALMNIPLKKPEWRQELWFPKDRKIIFTLLDILESAIMKSFPSYKNVEDSNPTLPGGLSIDEGITPLMILLTCIAKYDLESRKIIKAKIAPDNIDRTKGLDQSDTLEARMIGFMTSASHNNLKTTASDLLFTVLDENGSNLVAYTGYGHAAGFLYERGLSPADPSGGTAGTNNNGAKINPITGSLEVEKDSDEEEMEEEEREREAAKLMGLMDRLNKQGVIKPVFKN